MEIDKKIKEIQNYFINKVKTGDYKFIKSNDYTAEIIIDDKYEFQMWIGVNKDYYDFYNSFLFSTSIPISMKGLKSRGWVHMKKNIKKEDKTAEKRQKMKEFNRLKKELNI